MSLKLLIAEDEAALAQNIKTYLRYEEFQGDRFSIIDIAGNGAIAIRLVKNDYDAVILDLKMPKVDGTQVIEALGMLIPQKRPAIILITAYPGAFETARMSIKMGAQAVLKKPFELAELAEVLREIVSVRRQLLESNRRGIMPQCQWTLGLDDTGAFFVHVKGLLNYADNCLSVPPLKAELLQIMGRQQEIVGQLMTSSSELHRHWRFQAKNVGEDFFRKLFVGNVEKSFIAAGSVVLHNHDLKLTFVGPRHFLKLPVEFLNDGVDYLVLKHPMKRLVSGVWSKRHINLTDFCNQLWEKREKLRILLVASNTNPPIDAVDEEVAEIHNLLRTLSSDRYIVDYIPTEDATYGEIIDRLSGCRYHILHYAGHGYHDQKSLQGQSSLCFWTKKSKSGEIKLLTIDALKHTLRSKGHDLQFVYLSCCSGAAARDQNALLDDDYLGIADGLITADVPSVLGFRWPVSDQGAKEMALTFYQSLIEQGNLSMALFHARSEVAKDKASQDFGDWLSPILIAQGWG